MYLVLPTADHQRLELVENCLRGLRASPATLASLPPDLLPALQQQRDRLQTAYETLLHKRQQANTLLKQTRQRQRVLCEHLRDAFQLVQRQRRNPAFPASLFEAFGLKRDGSQTAAIHRLRIPTQIAWVVLNAAEMAAAKGFHLLTTPTPETLEAATHALSQAKDAYVAANHAQKSALRVMRHERLMTSQLLQRLRLSLRLAFIDRNQTARQMQLQELGFHFRHTPSQEQVQAPCQAETEKLPLMTDAEPQQTAGDPHANPPETHAKAPPSPATVQNQAKTPKRLRSILSISKQLFGKRGFAKYSTDKNALTQHFSTIKSCSQTKPLTQNKIKKKIQPHYSFINYTRYRNNHRMPSHA